MLTQEELKEYFEYNKDTGVFIWKVSRGQSKKGKIAGNLGNKGYIQIRLKGKSYQAHRLAWLYEFGSFPSVDLDHKDRDKTNNMISNLREVSSMQNSQNRSISTLNKTGVIGVMFLNEKRRKKRYVAHIKHKGKNIRIGYFLTLEEATKARKNKEIELGFINTLEVA